MEKTNDKRSISTLKKHISYTMRIPFNQFGYSQQRMFYRGQQAGIMCDLGMISYSKFRVYMFSQGDLIGLWCQHQGAKWHEQIRF